MPSVRRSPYVFFYFEEGGVPDIGALLRGAAEVRRERLTFALSLLTGETYPISPEELEILRRVPSDRWTAVESVSERHTALTPERLAKLIRRGLLLSDGDSKEAAELRERCERLRSGAWNVFAAFYHFMTRWSDVGFGLPADPGQDVDSAAATARAVEEYGPPPPHFHRRSPAAERVELPLADMSGGLAALLRRRKTTRAYDRDRSLPLERFGSIVHQVFGCQGYARIAGEVVGLKKTSPSGGGLHPVEAYPLVLNVAGIEPGLYHYAAEDHSLAPIEVLDRAEAEELADRFTAGQGYPRNAHALFVLTARFYRSFWKYRRHPRAYAVVLMDAAHLSQTLYLTCAEQGLGSFVTGAINSADIDRRLGLSPYEEGTILVLGCGIPREDARGLEPRFREYVPRQTRI